MKERISKPRSKWKGFQSPGQSGMSKRTRQEKVGDLKNEHPNTMISSHKFFDRNGRKATTDNPALSIELAGAAEAVLRCRRRIGPRWNVMVVTGGINNGLDIIIRANSWKGEGSCHSIQLAVGHTSLPQ